MSDPRIAFPVLSDDAASGVGTVLSQIQQNQVLQALVDRGLLAFGFQNSDGEAVLPTLTSEGKLPVSLEGAGVPYRAKGELAAGSATIVDVTGAVIALTNNKTYTKVAATVSCRQPALFQLIHKIDAVETDILHEIVLDSGMYTFSVQHDGLEIDTSAVGAHSLIVKAKNFGAGTGNSNGMLSSLRASISCVEIA